MGLLLLLLLHFSPYYFYFIKASYSESCLLSLSASKAEQEEESLVPEVLSQDLMLAAKSVLGAAPDAFGEAQLRLVEHGLCCCSWKHWVLLSHECSSLLF